MRIPQLVVALGLVGCQNSRDETKPPAPRPQVALDRTITLDKIAWPAPDDDPPRPYDCTVIPAMRSYFAGTRVENCGVLDIEAPDLEKATARSCVEAAVKAKRPFVFVQRVQGTDSGVVRAFLARPEGDTYVGYEATYDSDPCGGGCPEHGHTYIMRCKEAPSVPAKCVEGTAACLDCDYQSLATVEQCAVGTPSKFALVDSERARRALFDAKPTMLGAGFGPLVLGAPSTEWKSPAGVSARAAIEAGGIVRIEDHTRAPVTTHIDTIGLSFAGPCNHVRDEIIHAWGPPTAPPNRWVDPAAHRVATLDIAECYLGVSSYAEPEQWAAKDIAAPFPLVAPGMKLDVWLAKNGGEVEDGRISSRSMSIGSVGGEPAELRVYVSHGRATSWEADHVHADAATISRLRDQLTKLYGAPKEDLGTFTWRGTPKLTLSDGGDGYFTLEAE